MMNQYRRLKEETLHLVSDAPDERLTPHEAAHVLSHALRVSWWTVQQAFRDLVEEGDLVYTYRDPTSFLERSSHGRPTHPVA